MTCNKYNFPLSEIKKGKKGVVCFMVNNQRKKQYQLFFLSSTHFNKLHRESELLLVEDCCRIMVVMHYSFSTIQSIH